MSQDTMKAVIRTRYGGPEILKIAEVPRPTPAEGQVLIRVYAGALSDTDKIQLTGKPWLFVAMHRAPFSPRIDGVGLEIAGVVEAVGPGVQEFKPGDEVYANVSESQVGGFAEYTLADPEMMAHKPANISFEEASTIGVAGVAAFEALHHIIQLQPGQHVLIHGASGGIGTYCLMLAKKYGAEVTAVVSTRNLEMARELGADHVIDYTREDFTQNGQQYDHIVAANGDRLTKEYEPSLKPGGTFVCVGGTLRQGMNAIMSGPRLSKKTGKTLRALDSRVNKADLDAVSKLVAEGEIKPIIDKVYPMDEVQAAFRHYFDEHAQGRIVLSMRDGASG